MKWLIYNNIKFFGDKKKLLTTSNTQLPFHEFINITGYSHAYQEVNNEEQTHTKRLGHEVQPLTVL